MAAKIRVTDRLQFQQPGAAGAIAKPFEPLYLVETISQLF